MQAFWLATLAFLTVQLNAIRSTLVTNALGLLLRYGPILALAIFEGLEWKLESPWGRARLIARLVLGIVIALELLGALPVIRKAPVPAPKT